MRILHALPLLLAIAPAFGQYPAPQPLFSKTFGGSSGSDAATSLAVDANGNVAVLGTTSSPDFPVTNAYQPRIADPPLTAITAAGASNPPLGAIDVIALAASVDGSVVYAASDAGIYRSTDSGGTWSRQTSAFAGGPRSRSMPGNAGIVYATLVAGAGPGIAGGVFKSTDAGVTWTSVGHLRGPLFAAAQRPGLLYSLGGAIYRSSDGGATWSGNLDPHTYNIFAAGFGPLRPNVSFLPLPLTGSSTGAMTEGDTWTAPGGSFTAYPNANASLYIDGLAVDPKQENTIWALNSGGTLSKSTDGGASFTIVRQVGADARYLSVDTSGRNIVAGGMDSFDGGLTWQSLPSAGYLSSVLALPSAILIGSEAPRENFLTKWSAGGGTMLFSTFLTSDGAGRPPVIASDPAGDTWVASDVLMKFDPSGTLLFSHPLGQLAATAIVLDHSGNVFLTAYNYNVSSGCTAPAAQNGSIPIAMKFDPQGNPFYSTPLPQLCQGSIYGLAVDSAGALYLAGNTASMSLPVSPTAIEPVAPPPPAAADVYLGDGFLAVLSPSGNQLTYLSYIGGSQSAARAVAVDADGNVYVTGDSVDANFPFTPSAYLRTCPPGQDAGSFAFVMKLNVIASAPAWVTELGGDCEGPDSEGAVGSQLLLDPAGNVWVGGVTGGSLPTVAPFELQGVDQDFISELSPGGAELLFSSYAPGPFAFGPGNTFYVAGAVTPNPPKTAVPLYGEPVATYAIVEAFTLTGSQSAVIDSIPIPGNSSPEPQLFGLAPGELIRITGRGLGPSGAVGGQFDASGRVATSLAGTRVLFNGVPARSSASRTPSFSA